MKKFILLIVVFTCTAAFSQKNNEGEIVAGERQQIQKSESNAAVDVIQKPYSKNRYIMELSQTFGVGKYGLDLIKGNFLYNYLASENFSLGFGTGLRVYFDSGVYIPFLADFRYRFEKDAIGQDVSPYLNLQFGYSLDISDDDWDHAGPIFKPGGGVAFTLNNGNKINVGLALDMMKFEFVRTTITTEGIYRDHPVKYSPGISLSVGYEF